MPRRDGTLTVEELLAAQAAGDLPAVQPRTSRAAELAALGVTATAVAQAEEQDGAPLTTAAVMAAGAGILAAFDRFLADRRREQQRYLPTLLEEEMGEELDREDRLVVVDDELQRERAFQAKARARMDRDLPRALSIADPAVREATVQRILARERHYLSLREAAVADRALGLGEKEVVKRNSPEGAYWRLSPYVAEHTPDCLAMGGKVWPWSVLDDFHPPLHFGCPCELWELERAARAGLLGPGSVQAADAVIFARSLSEVAVEVDPDALEEELALLEAAYERRWPKGTAKAGEFRPRRGGDPGARVGKRAARARATRDRHASIVRAKGRERPEPKNAPDAKVSTLKVGDSVYLDGHWSTITEVRGNGLFVTEESGLVHIDPDRHYPTARGKAGKGEPKGGPTRLALTAAEGGDAFERQLRAHDPGHDDDKYEGGRAAWAKNLRGRVSDNAEARDILRDAVEENDANDIYRSIVERHGGDAVVLVSSEKTQGNATMHSGLHNVDNRRQSHTTITSDLAVRMSGRRKGKPIPGDFGVMSQAGHAAVLRHEFGHTLVNTPGQMRSPYSLTNVERAEVLALVPDDPDQVERELGKYAAVELRGDYGKTAGDKDEALAELFALATDPGFDRDEWAPWVQQGTDWMLRRFAPAHAIARDRQRPDSPPDERLATNDDYAVAVAVTQARLPDGPAELAPGVRFDPDLTRSTVDDEGNLVLPPGFFKLTRAAREGVVFRHFGRRLNVEGLSRKDTTDTYLALNSPALRDRMADLHPESARAVARAARDAGVPLSPEARSLADRPDAPVGQDTPAHPAHAIADRVRGMSYVEAIDHLREAGYSDAGSDEEARSVQRNIAHRASITIADTDAGVEASVEVVPDLPEAEAAKIVGTGRPWEAIEDSLRAEGFGPATRYSTDVMGWVHPDGRGRAVIMDGDGEAIEAVAFTPTASERQQVSRYAIGMDPRIIPAGMGIEEAQRGLQTGGWRQMRVHLPDDGAHGIEGATGFFDYERPVRGSDVPERMRVAVNGSRVTAVGRPGEEAGLSVLVEEGPYQATRRAEEERRARAREEAATARDTEVDRYRADIAAGKAPDFGSANLNEAVTFMRDRLGWEVRARRRSRRKGEPVTTYTLRGPQGETMKITGTHTFSASSVREVKLEGNPQGGRRERIRGRLPKDRKELFVDALGRADELGERFGAGVHVTAILESGVSRGGAAHHESNGSIVVGPGDRKVITDYLKRRHAGEELDDRDHLAFYNSVETVQHELNHGIGARGDGDGGLAFSSRRHYRTATGKAVEETLTEETAHILTVEWLREWGLDDVVAAVKRNPTDARVTGVYQSYRRQVRQTLAAGGVPEEGRRELLMRMKFQMSPEEQYAELTRGLPEGTSLLQAFHARPRDRAYEPFAPIIRPDLSAIVAWEGDKGTAEVGDRVTFTYAGSHGAGRVVEADENRVRVQILEGSDPHDIPRSAIERINPSARAPREFAPGDAVTVTVDTGEQVEGTVIETRPGYVRVETPDGLRLWVSVGDVRGGA